MKKITIINSLILLIYLIISSCDTAEPTSREAIILFELNKKIPMTFKNYLGNNENIHPKVLFFENHWNGYEFWMAYTPYSKGRINTENPCIAVSHDGLNWKEPDGIRNPLVPAPNNGYNSDTHLVFDSINDLMEIWYRDFDLSINQDAILRKISTDGISWSEPEKLIDYNQFGEMVLSPVVWIENDHYFVIYSNGKRLKYIKALKDDEKLNWTTPIELEINWGDLSAWHLDIMQEEDKTLKLVVCAFSPEGNNNAADLYLVTLNSNLEAVSDPLLIVERGKDRDDFDYRSIYRSSLVKANGMYYLYYSAIDDRWSRHLALIITEEMFPPLVF